MPPTLRFGIFELNPQAGELRKNGMKIKLHGQPVDILVMLLKRPGETVTREELQKELWPADTFVDFEQGLNNAMKRLRAALNDDAERPRFIETLPRHGYRFIAATVPDAIQPEKSQSPLRRSRLPLVAALVLAVATLAAGILWRVKQHPPYPLIEKRITANSVEAPIRAAVVSPDGKYVAYADPTGVYLCQTDGSETRPLPLPRDFSAFPSSWFPDSTHLLVTHVTSGQKRSVWKVSILGGNPQMLVDDAEDGVVSPDGSQIVFFRRTFLAAGNFEGAGALWLMASNGRNPYKFVGPTELPGSEPLGINISAVSWAPDGQRIAYIEEHASYATFPAGNSYWLLTRDLTGRQSQVILRDHRMGLAGLCWAPDGRLLYTLPTDPKRELGNYGVWAIRVDQDTGKAKGNPERVSDGLGQIGRLSVTTDGKRLVLSRRNIQPQVFVSEFDKSAHRLRAPRRLTMDENLNLPTAWTPNSKSVLLVSYRHGAREVFKQDIDQPTAEVVIQGRVLGNAFPRLSADGSEILFTELSEPDDASVPIRLMGMPLSGGVPRLILQDRGIGNLLCARIPSTVCVFNKVVGATSSFVTFDTERGKGHEIARFDGYPNWGLSPNGSELVVITDENRGWLRFISLATGATREVVVKDWPVLNGVDWTADGRSVLSGSVTPTGISVILDIDLGGTARVLLEGDPHTHLRAAIPSPDGHYVALIVDIGESNVWTVESF